MKKYVAAFAVIAAVGVAGALYVNEKMDDTTVDTDTSTTSSSYAQQVDGNNVDTDDADDNKTEEAPTEQDKKESTFYGEIDSVKGNTVTVIVNDGEEILSSGDKVAVGFNDVEITDSNGKKIKDDDVGNFKNATVTYDGTVMETYPLQVNASKIVLKNRTDCNVYFCLEGGENIDTLTIPVGSTLESADMPNAGAYCPDGYHFEGWTLNGETIYGISEINDTVSVIAKISKD